jgi:uncharacterized protein YjiS (DUF1127 family)
MAKLPNTLDASVALTDFIQPVLTVFPLAMMKTALQGWIARRATSKVLQKLNDSQLDDIGLSRDILIDAIIRPERRYHGD